MVFDFHPCPPCLLRILSFTCLVLPSDRIFIARVSLKARQSLAAPHGINNLWMPPYSQERSCDLFLMTSHPSPSAPCGSPSRYPAPRVPVQEHPMRSTPLTTVVSIAPVAQ